MQSLKQDHKSREARIGAVAFSNDQLHFNMGYTKCEHCSSRIKILATPDEARQIAKHFGYYKPKFKERIAKRIQKWALDV